MNEQRRGIGIGWEERKCWVRKGSGADEWTFDMGFVAYYVPSRSIRFRPFIST